MNRCLISLVGVAAATGGLFFGAPSVAADLPELAVIRPDLQTGFVNAGWNHDRYQDLPPLDAHKTITLADLKGPGIIRHIHLTRHNPKELAARGVVLEIWFDDVKEPAVQCPLADFFGDGCNGEAMNFSSALIECAPWSYNCYFPMPFARRARVILRNDTDQNTDNYSYVEWEPLPRWNPQQGYFHATYRRDSFQLKKDTDYTLLELKGTGHVVGRQFSILTDEPLFNAFAYVMEGNNEIDIDGRVRQLDYLGTEDSFTFSWGFQKPFSGVHAGITIVDNGKINRVSLYRLHDHMPIRFTKSLRWHINWSQERIFTGGQNGANWDSALQRDGCWVDYAHVHYWYQDQPGGYKHAPLPGMPERSRPLLHAGTSHN